jgi:hypothetical protein
MFYQVKFKYHFGISLGGRLRRVQAVAWATVDKQGDQKTTSYGACSRLFDLFSRPLLYGTKPALNPERFIKGTLQ